MKEQGYFSAVMYKDCGIREFANQLYYVAETLDSFVENYEIIVVLGEELDDECTRRLQGAKDIIEGHVILVTLSNCQNLACGMLAGIDLAIGDYIYEIESVVTRDVCRHMTAMYKSLTEDGYDAVFLRPNHTGMLYTMATKVLGHIGGTSIVLGDAMMRLVSRRSLNVMDHYRENENTRNLMYQLCGLRVKHMYSQCHGKRAKGNLVKEIGYFLRAKKLGSRCAYVLAGIYVAIFFGLLAMGKTDRSYMIPIFLLSFSILLILLGMLMNHLLLLYREAKNNACYTVLEVRRLK